MYHPHGGPVSKWGGSPAATAEPGASTSKEDVYWIFYAPLTTASGKVAGRDRDGYIMAAFRDDGDNNFEATFANGAITANQETEITDIQWITP